MADIKFKKEYLDDLIAAVSTELTDMLKAESAALAKSDEDGSPEKDAPAETSEGSEGPAAPPAADAPPAEASAPPAEASAPPAEASAPPAMGAEGSAPADAAPAPIAPAPTVESLQAEIMKEPPEYQKMLFLACKAALMATMGADQGMAPPGAEGSAPPPPAPAPPGPPPGAAPMAMAEIKSSPGNGGQMKAGKLGKSEDQVKIENLEKQLSDQNDALTGLVKAVERLATPVRKSAKTLDDLRFVNRTATETKDEKKTLSKAEVKAVLVEKIREGKLSKADKELVAKYTVGAVDVTKIEHLLNATK
jgi:hypothetical protein